MSGAPVPSSSSSEVDVSMDDDALIEAALKDAAEEDNSFEALQRRAEANAAAAAAANEGETYISETGEVMKRRAPRKKKVAEKTEEEKAADEEERKQAAIRAERLLANLLHRTNEVMIRTMEGTAAPGMVKDASIGSAAASKKRNRGKGDRRNREDEEDDELLDDLDDTTLPNGAIQLRAQPPIVTGSMRAYQLEGLNWMIRLYHSGVSGILADEMGLGKTLQSISLLAYLNYYQNLKGPHLVLVPLSTLGNWHREFERWCPTIRCSKFHGGREERAKLIAEGALRPENWDVLLTSYEMSIREKAQFQKVKWNFIIVDEAHRLKNEDSLLSQIVRIFHSTNRLLITGTPLQNNLHELWALLNFLLPDIFSSGEDFDEMFSASENDSNVSNNLLAQLHKILRPFMLRRLKSQVAQDLPPKKETILFVGMSEIQAKLYRGVLERDIDAVLGKCKEKSRLMNMVMQLRKCSNHPYLFENVEDRSLPALGDHLINTSGKMVVMDKLLARFKAQGSRVLIFSQMTRVLDILEDYCAYRSYEYCRIDGSTMQEDREVMMKEYNAPNSTKFIFLLSTRAGGLGINLNTADIVILYDSDWNPQQDLQAVDRAHRIGQTKPVFAFRLITENSIEEKIIERAEIKLRLDAMVIQQGKQPQKQTAKGAMSADDVSSMIRFGADRIFRQTGSTITDADIDTILLAGEQRTQELNSKLGKHVGLFDLSLDGAPPMILPDEHAGELPLDELERQMMMNLHDSMGRRDRTKGKSYDVNAYYREAMKADAKDGSVQRSHLPKPYKIPRMPDYQLFQSKRIMELSEKEKSWYEKHAFDPTVPAIRGGLTIEEDAELQRLLAEGFGDWQWSDYTSFIEACQRHGRHAMDKIINAMSGHNVSVDSIKRYQALFFERAPHMSGFRAALDKIARGEARAKKFAELENLLEQLLADYPQRTDVMEKLHIHYPPLLKGRGYNLLEDRALLYWCRQLGYGEWKQLRRELHKDADFRFDYFLKSRSAKELNRRVDALLRGMRKEESKKASKRKISGAIAQNQVSASAPVGSGAGAFSSLHPSPSPSPSVFAASRASPASSATGMMEDADDVPLILKRRALKQEQQPAYDEDAPLIQRKKTLMAMKAAKVGAATSIKAESNQTSKNEPMADI